MTTGIDAGALYRLQTWLSPSFPVGAYTFSHGLEYAVEAGWVSDAHSAREWIDALLQHGTAQADLVLVCAGWDAVDSSALQGAIDQALAMAASRELLLESVAQGDAFVHAIDAAWPCEVAARLKADVEQRPYPVVVGAVARAHAIAREATAHAYAHAFVSNLVSALLRAVPLGQTDGQRLLSDLQPQVVNAVARASTTELADMSSSTPMSDIASMRHEHQYTRLFRS